MLVRKALIIVFYFHWFCFPTYLVQSGIKINKRINQVQSGIVLTSTKLHIPISTSRDCTSVALFTKILTIKNCRKCKTKIKKSFTKIFTIILSVKIVLTLRVKLPCRKCKIFVLSFIVSEKIEQKKMDDALALRFKNKIAIHR